MASEAQSMNEAFDRAVADLYRLVDTTGEAVSKTSQARASLRLLDYGARVHRLELVEQPPPHPMQEGVLIVSERESATTVISYRVGPSGYPIDVDRYTHHIRRSAPFQAEERLPDVTSLERHFDWLSSARISPLLVAVALLIRK